MGLHSLLYGTTFLMYGTTFLIVWDYISYCMGFMLDYITSVWEEMYV